MTLVPLAIAVLLLCVHQGRLAQVRRPAHGPAIVLRLVRRKVQLAAAYLLGARAFGPLARCLVHIAKI